MTPVQIYNATWSTKYEKTYPMFFTFGSFIELQS